METNITKPSFEEVKELLPETVDLVQTDYRDNLNDNMGEVQTCIHSGEYDRLYDVIDFIEAEHQGLDFVLRELKSDMESEFDLDEDECDEIMDEYEEQLRDAIYLRDESTPLKDMISNTREIVAFYTTGLELDSNWDSEALRRLQRIQIKKMLHIKDDSYDDDLDMMIAQASYGGELVIYFHLDFDLFMSQDLPSHIQFADPEIAVIDVHNGSGDNCSLGGHTITLPFNRENVFLDKAIKYNYTYAVCGMSSNWCEDTVVSFLNKEEKAECEVQKSSIHGHLSKEDQYNKIFNEGKCTFGDMDMRRHRNVTYINNFPCGNKCLDCGTFWID